MRRLILFVVGVIGALMSPLVASAGFGITPPYVRNDTLRPGSEFTQEVVIVRSDPDQDLDAKLQMNVPGFDSWITPDRGLDFILPKGQQQTVVRFNVKVPTNAKLGDYRGSIRISTGPAGAQASGVSIALGAQLDVYLKVRDEIFDFAVRRVQISDAEESTKKLWLEYPGKVTFSMNIENTGNVPAAPYAVRLEVYDIAGRQVLETTKSTNSMQKILPFTSRMIDAYIPTFLPPGSYRVKYNVMKEQDSSAQVGELTLSIFPHGTIPGYVGYGFEGLSLGDQLSLILPAVALTLVVLTPVLGRKKRKNRRARPVDGADAPRGERVGATPTRPTVRSRATITQTVSPVVRTRTAAAPASRTRATAVPSSGSVDLRKRS